MTRLYILEQKIRTLEIIIETIVDELVEEGLIDEVRFDNAIIEKIKKLSEELEIEKKNKMKKKLHHFRSLEKKVKLNLES
jgi:polyhydroxyalkanoate synthesis regulator phasin